MANLITDPTTLDRMIEVDIPRRILSTPSAQAAHDERLAAQRESYKATQTNPADLYLTFVGAVALWEKFCEEVPDAEARKKNGCAIAVIYGPGGWHRWMVDSEGEVCFSHHHSTDEGVERSVQFNFKAW